MIQCVFLLFTILLLSLIPQKNKSISVNQTDNLSVSNSSPAYLFNYQHTTSLRGIAIMMILLGHISGTFKTVILSPLASTGVTLFMILSGYGLYCSYNKNGLKRFWGKKYIRVMIPYIIVITTLMLIKNEFNVSRFLLEITGLKTTYWYVDYQIKWYIVFFFTMLLAARYSLTLFAVASAAMFFVLPSLAAEQSFAFLIGVVIAKYGNYVNNFSRKKWAYLMCTFTIIGLLFLISKQTPLIREFIGTKPYSAIQLFINLNLGLAILCASCLIPVMRSSFLFIFAGTISYEIYLLHFPFYGYVNGNILYAFVLIFASLLFAKLYSQLVNLISGKINITSRL